MAGLFPIKGFFRFEGKGHLSSIAPAGWRITLYWIYDLPTWQLGLLIVSSFLLIGLGGLLSGRPWIYRRFRISNDTNESVNGFFAGVGVLYGILLGLVAVADWENYENVDGLAGKEASAVAALYRDVSTLQDPTRTELQEDLRRYLHFVVEVAWPAHRKGESPNGGTLILSEFLGTVANYHATSTEQEIFLSEVFSAYNKLIEARRLRLAAVDTCIPPIFWIVIISGGVLSLVITYFFHLPAMRTHLMLTGLFSVFLGLMIFLVVALDNPFRGEVSVSPDAYLSVLNGLQELEPIQAATKPGTAAK
jgi:hypothetical protein